MSKRPKLNRIRSLRVNQSIDDFLRTLNANNFLVTIITSSLRYQSWLKKRDSDEV